MTSQQHRLEQLQEELAKTKARNAQLEATLQALTSSQQQAPADPPADPLPLLLQLLLRWPGLADVLDALPMGVTILNARTGQPVYANGQLLRMLPNVPGQPKDFGRFLHWQLFRLNGQFYKPEELPWVRASAGQTIVNEEMMCLRPDGHWLILAVNAIPVRDVHGQVVAVVGTAEETARRRSADPQGHVLHRLVRMVAQGNLLIRNPEDRITYWSQGAEQTYGFSAQEAVGSISHDLLKTRFPEPLSVILSKLRRNNRWEAELTHTCKDGRQITVTSQWITHYDDRNNLAAILEINNDITDRKRMQEALVASHQRTRRVLESITDCYFRLDPQGNILAMNRWAAAYLGQRWPQAVGRNLWSLLPQLEGSRYQKIFRKVRATHRPADEEMRSVINPGRWVELHAVPCPEGVEVYFRDITERKQAEENLATDLADLTRLQTISKRLIQQGDVQSLLEEVLEAAIGMTGADKGNIQLLNATGEQLEIAAQRGFGEPFLAFFRQVRPGQAVCGQAWQQGRQVFAEDLTQDTAMDPPARDTLLAAGVQAVQSTPLITRSGRLVGMLSTHWLEPHPLEEHALRLLDMLARQVADMIERTTTEQARRESHAKLRAVLENSPDAVYRHDLQTDRYDYISPAIEQITGFSAEQVQAMTRRDMLARIHPEDQARVQAEMAVAIQAGKGILEYRLAGKDGRYRWLSDRFTVQTDEQGRPVYYGGIVRDISDRKQAEQQLTEALQQRTAEAQQRATQLHKLAIELTRAEQRERQRLASLLHDHLQQLLVASKIKAKVLQIGLKHDPLAESVQEVMGLLDESIKASRSLAMDLAPPILHEPDFGRVLAWLADWMKDKHGLQVQIQMDRTAHVPTGDIRYLLFRAIRELLFNVVKHAGTNRAVVRVMQIHDHVQVIVADKGHGFDVAKEAKDRSTGGFGLVSLRERLEMLGGHMRIESRPGHGTQVTVAVPGSSPGRTNDTAAGPHVSQ